jgi:hypothetical protein
MTTMNFNANNSSTTTSGNRNQSQSLRMSLPGTAILVFAGLCVFQGMMRFAVQDGAMVEIVALDVAKQSTNTSDTASLKSDKVTNASNSSVTKSIVDAAAAVKLYQDEAFEGFQRRRPAPTQPDCIVAFHVPKTGGSSFKFFLNEVSRTMGWTMQEWYSYRNRYHDPAPRGMLREKVIHSGHLTPTFLNATATQNCLTVTMIREPVDRVISCFYYHGHNTREWESCLRHDTPCWLARQYQNDVTRMFSVNTTWNRNQYIYKTYSAERIDREHLERAQQFLMDTDLVCFLDQFDDCKRKLLAMANLALKVPASAGPKDKENVGKRRKNITVNTRSQIELVNSLDIELYEWAVQQFREGNRQRKR